MACGNCGGSAGGTIIHQGSGISITGTGTAANPYVIKQSNEDIRGLLRVVQSATVNLSLQGNGTEGNPLRLSADAVLSLRDLQDVEGGAPATGEVPVWRNGRFQFELPPAAPAGAVNVDTGLDGVGSAADPLVVRTSGIWGQGPLAGLGDDSAIGGVIYEDEAGVLRAEPRPATTWDSIADKPALAAANHSHSVVDITDLLESGNVGQINGHRIHTYLDATTRPADPRPGDIVLFPRSI